MSAQESMPLKKRMHVGTGAARACRREGMIPGVIYGAGKNPEEVAIDPKTFAQERQRTGFFSRVFTLDVEGKKEQALVKDVQLHPVTDAPIHVDFMRVSKDTKIHVHVPLHFIHEEKAPELKRGGVLNVVHHSLEVVATPGAVPEAFTIDLSTLDLSKGIHLSDLPMPQGVVPAHPLRDNTLATVVMPKMDTEEATPTTE